MRRALTTIVLAAAAALGLAAARADGPQPAPAPKPVDAPLPWNPLAEAIPGDWARYRVADTATWGAPIVAGNRVFVKGRETLALWMID